MRRSPGASRRRPAVLVLVVVVALVLCVQSLQDLVEPAPAGSAGPASVEPVPVGELNPVPPPTLKGYAGPSFDSGSTVTPTGDGDASQVWFTDDRWWGVMVDEATDEFHVWAYDPAAGTWNDTGTLVDDRPFVRPDVLWDGEHLYVVGGGRRTYRSDGVRLSRLTFDAKQRRWETDPDFPVSVTETGVGDPLLAKDPAGTLWLSYVLDGRLYVAHTDGSDAVWTDPALLPGPAEQQLVSGMSMTAHNAGVSVVWVPRHTNELQVTTHLGPGEGTWETTTRTIYGLGGIDPVARLDDLTPTNLSVRAAGTGPDRRLYVAFKTSLREQGTNDEDPQVLLAIIEPDGGTTTTMVSEVADDHSNPVVAIDRAGGRVLVIATSSNELGGVYVTAASLRDPAFAPGLGERVIYRHGLAGADHAVTAKHDLDAASGLLVVASDDVEGQYATGLEPLGGDRSAAADPPPPLPADPPTRNVLVHDTFDEQPIGGPIPRAYVPETAGGAVARSQARVVSVTGSRGASLQLSTGSAGAAIEYCRKIPLTPEAPVTVVAHVLVSAIGTADAHLLSLNGGGPIASVRATNKGRVGFLTPAGRLQGGSLPTGVFLRVSITVEPATRTYFLTVSPRDGGAAVLALGRQPWAGARLAAIEEVCFQTGSGGPGLAVVFDELLVTEG